MALTFSPSVIALSTPRRKASDGDGIAMVNAPPRWRCTAMRVSPPPREWPVASRDLFSNVKVGTITKFAPDRATAEAEIRRLWLTVIGHLLTLLTVAGLAYDVVLDR
jgi:hypothetical protein